MMAQVETARVFMNGRSQAVRIPVEYRFKSDQVYIRRNARSGEIILSENPPQPSLAEIFAMIDAARGEEELQLDRDMAPPQERDWM